MIGSTTSGMMFNSMIYKAMDIGINSKDFGYQMGVHQLETAKERRTWMYWLIIG